MVESIPDDALDDRLGFVGTAGSGKTYNAGGRVEQLLVQKARCIVIDPLDVWWGLRLLPDGKTPSPFDIVILGGQRGDLPLNEHAGALIGETVARAGESFIISLGTLGTKAAERRFMLAFLTALYRHVSGEPVHLIFDEADLWAPQRLLDKEGEAAKLLGQMETIVRRGRIKGFIPWLITQRPAVLSKDVLSQVDGLVALKLTSSQDRDAIGDWVQGQADKTQWNAIWASLPTMQRGTGVVWIPGRGILETITFPPKRTFDSSATPKRGERKMGAALLQPLNVDALKARLETVAKEAVENDPRRLKTRIAELEKQLRVKSTPDPEALGKRYQAGLAEGRRIEAAATAERVRDLQYAIDGALGFLLPEAKWEGGVRMVDGAPPRRAAIIDHAPVAQRIEHSPSKRVVAGSIPAGRAKSVPEINGGIQITAPQQRVLDALAWWRAIRVSPATRVQVALVAGYSQGSGGYGNLLGALRSAALIDYPSTGMISLTPAGAALAMAPMSPPSTEELHARVFEVVSAPQQRILRALIEAYPNALDRQTLGERTDYSPTSGGFANLLGSLRSLKLIDYPDRGAVIALPVLFIDDREEADNEP